MHLYSFLTRLLLSVFLLGTLAVAGCGNGDKADDDKTLHIIWAKWAPADGLQELAKDFTAETGIPVEIRQEPWKDYADKVKMDFTGATTTFDIVVGDSQWIGRGVRDGQYVELTDWMKQNIDLSQVSPGALKYLCEYPPGSGKYYAAPCETDAVGFVYRKDWFEDAGEKDKFKAKYGRDLAPPQTWEELRDIAEFFNRPSEKRFGLALLTGQDYDSLTMGFQPFLWSWGGDWYDGSKVDGVVNSPAAVDALKFFVSLMQFGPPDAKNLNYDKTPDYFRNGSVAMAMNYFAFFPDLAKEMPDKVGFFVMPAHNGNRAVSLGGQGFSISTKTSAAKQEMARKFIAWFNKPETQKKWITKPGGFTANAALLKSDEFAKATPYNKAFAESIDHVKDFWNIPEYEDLLHVSQDELAAALNGKDAKQALDDIAKKHTEILKKAGVMK